MSQLEEAVHRYNRLVEVGKLREPAWAEHLQEQMEEKGLTASGRLICPFLRPSFVTRKQYDSLVKTSETLISAIDRIQQMVLASPPLMARMQLLPAEKMLAGIHPGCQFAEVVSRLDSHLYNGTVRVVQYNADTPSGMGYAEVLADIFYDSPPMKQMRKRYHVSKLGGKKNLLQALLKAYRGSSGQKKQKPNIAILEFRQPFRSFPHTEYELFRDYFQGEGYATEIVSPEQLEYRGGVLRRGDFVIDLIYRRISVQEFLLRFDLSHPLVEAYRDRAVCVVNSFRSELAHKKAIFGLLTDESLLAGFPAPERKVVREHVPWTRVVGSSKTTYREKTVDLLEFIQKNREKLVLKPNDDYSDLQSYYGWEMNGAAWERAVREATRSPYVVQERVEAFRSVFPLLSYGTLEFREMQVDVHPHVYLGKVQGCSSWLSSVSGFTTAAGLAPTFLIEPRS
ncbi:MAG: circularly permuted type 2 ATP-grasp protein [Acidobacteria bacterium]|nr:circularly permuted type 2 ATP-grasp protein [Acidobacteriota bacterium]